MDELCLNLLFWRSTIHRIKTDSHSMLTTCVEAVTVAAVPNNGFRIDPGGPMMWWALVRIFCSVLFCYLVIHIKWSSLMRLMSTGDSVCIISTPILFRYLTAICNGSIEFR